MISMPNSHLVLHKETLKQHFENKTSIRHLIKIINLLAKNCPVGRNGLNEILYFISHRAIQCFKLSMSSINCTCNLVAFSLTD